MSKSVKRKKKRRKKEKKKKRKEEKKKKRKEEKRKEITLGSLKWKRGGSLREIPGKLLF